MSIKLSAPNEQGIRQAHRSENGKLINLVCPFRNPIAVPGNLGGFTLVVSPCTTECPHLEIDFDRRKTLTTDTLLPGRLNCISSVTVFKPGE